MAKVSTIDLAYEFLKAHKGDASFEDIWNAISKDIQGDNDHKNEIIAELYSDLVLDNRFALTVDGKWGLRDYLKFEDVKKQYDYIDKFETTEEFDDIDSYLDDEIYGVTDTAEQLSKVKRSLDADDYNSDDDEDLDDDDDEDDDDDDFVTDEDSYDDEDN